MYRKSFALITTMILIVILGTFSLQLIQNNIFVTNLNKLKYLELQAQIYMRDIKDFISTSTDIEISNFILNDNRFKVKIIKIDDINSSIYYFTIESLENDIKINNKFIKPL
ncbi:MAG: hypothetical protein U9Q30_07855 [Campylobacterota bacterium]|nr:hypothetical protein [Campylobacterota bacterium]